VVEVAGADVDVEVMDVVELVKEVLGRSPFLGVGGEECWVDWCASFR
jgi:hypothetical protein